MVTGPRGNPPRMAENQAEAPILEALARYADADELAFTPRATNRPAAPTPRPRGAGDAVFYGDVLASGGLDDRLTRGRTLERAEILMAEAVHADHTFFSTCGSSCR